MISNYTQLCLKKFTLQILKYSQKSHMGVYSLTLQVCIPYYTFTPQISHRKKTTSSNMLAVKNLCVETMKTKAETLELPA